ncbi:hypothetical protein K2224_39010 (plasmid) [Streptomyces sp. BHT-5-2]|uniref:hypothetical protein n=1 Tax=unclassified Streptomyces TaxID=2593676 RepID=UPI001C8E7F94|nr:hypothetical protein [Streptomyces sp. BHT-5-2]QZL08975.1 hypothetical protein K2224_39010 [Streptomyces sp. BHT-5-2]
MRQLAVAAALFGALLPTTASAHPAVARSARIAAVPTGHVYFWPKSGQMGGAWDYSPPGYKEATPPVKRSAVSFDSHASVTVYAISYENGGGCLYRAIHPDDYSENWEWAGKFDGVSNTTMGCEAG